MKVRMLLLVALIVSVLMFAAGLKLSSFVPSEGDSNVYEIFWALAFMCLTFPSPFMFLAAVVMLIFSFIKVDRDKNGNLTYSSNTFYWKIINWMCNINSQERVSICSLFWRTVLATLYIVICIFGIFVLGLVIFLVATSDFSSKPTFDLMGILVSIAIALLLVSVAWDLYFASGASGKIGSTGMILSGIIFLSAVILGLMERNETSLLGAIGLLLGYAALFVVGMTAVLFILFLLIKVVLYLRNKIPQNFLDLVGQMIKGVCPIVKEAKKEVISQ